MEETRNKLAGALIGLARSTEGNEYLIDEKTLEVFSKGLAALTKPADIATIKELQPEIDRERIKLAPACHICVAKCGKTDPYNMDNLKSEPECIEALKLQLLEKAIWAAEGRALEPSLWDPIIKALIMIGIEGYTEDTLVNAIEQLG